MLYEFVRPLACPFEKIEKYVAERGKILDVGCGHGLFAKLIAEKSTNRWVLGIDPSNKKIEVAKRNNDLKNLAFRRSYLKDVKGGFNCISIIDVLYLLPNEEKLKVFNKCRELLKKQGLLILVENGDGKELIYQILKIQERLVRIFNFTYSDFKGFYFLDNKGYRSLLLEAGFKVETEKDLKSLLPYPHTLFVASKI